MSFVVRQLNSTTRQQIKVLLIEGKNSNKDKGQDFVTEKLSTTLNTQQCPQGPQLD